MNGKTIYIPFPTPVGNKERTMGTTHCPIEKKSPEAATKIYGCEGHGILDNIPEKDDFH